eukprot:1335569-Prorocentrum_lima.AAC.1
MQSASHAAVSNPHSMFHRCSVGSSKRQAIPTRMLRRAVQCARASRSSAEPPSKAAEHQPPP